MYRIRYPILPVTLNVPWLLITYSLRGVNLYKTLGGTEIGKIWVSASAEGAKLRLPKARSLSRLQGLGNVLNSPSGVWGGAPEADAIFNILCQNGVHFWI